MQSGGTPQVPVSGGFAPGLNVCLGSPGALALASAWFPSGQTARPTHLKVIRLGVLFCSHISEQWPAAVCDGPDTLSTCFPQPTPPIHLSYFIHPCPRPTNPPKPRANRDPFLSFLINICKDFHNLFKSTFFIFPLIRTLRPRVVKWLAQNHTAGKVQSLGRSWGLASIKRVLKCGHHTTIYHKYSASLHWHFPSEMPEPTFFSNGNPVLNLSDQQLPEHLFSFRCICSHMGILWNLPSFKNMSSRNIFF